MFEASIRELAKEDEGNAQRNLSHKTELTYNLEM
jgi:hypothetical protein